MATCVNEPVVNPFQRLVTVLGATQRCACAPGQRCPDCDEVLDTRESVAGRADRANFLMLKAAFMALEQGEGRIERAASTARELQGRAKAAVSNLARVLSRQGMSRTVRELVEETAEAQLTLDRMLDGFLWKLGIDLGAAGRELDAIRRHMQDMDALQTRLQEVGLRQRRQEVI